MSSTATSRRGQPLDSVNRVLHLSQKPGNPSASCTIEMIFPKEYLGLGMGIFSRTQRNSMSSSREDRSKSPDPPVGSERNLRRTNNPVDERNHFPSSNRRQTNLTSKPSSDLQPTAPGPSSIETSRAKSSGASSSSRRSKEEKRSGPSDECRKEDEDGTGISLKVFGEPSATEDKDQSSSTDEQRGSRKV